MGVASAWALAAWLFAAPTLPAAGSGPPPPELALHGHRLHLVVNEALEPERLRPLARPGTVLWVRTRSNALSPVFIERLAAFPEVFVELRPPLLDLHAEALKAAPDAGLLLQDTQLGGVGLYRLGGRPLAVRIEGALTEARLTRLRQVKPVRVLWEPSAEPSAQEWARFFKLGGARLVRPVVKEGDALRCPSPPQKKLLRTTALWLNLEAAPDTGTLLPPCAMRVRARVPLTPSDRFLSRLYAEQPGVELELQVGSEETAAGAARLLLERLERASGAGRTSP
jgi:hypothetical protein